MFEFEELILYQITPFSFYFGSYLYITVLLTTQEANGNIFSGEKLLQIAAK